MSVHVTNELGAFLDGELPAADRAAIAAHLRECAPCRQRLEEMTAVDEAVRSVAVEAPAGYFDDFASRVRTKLRAPAKRRFRPPAWTLAVAAALVLAVLTPLTLRQIQTTPSNGVAEAPAPAPVAADKVQQEAKLQAAPATLAERQPAQAEPEAQKALKDAPAAAPLEKRRAAKPDEAVAGGQPDLAPAPAAPAPLKEEEASRDEAAPPARPAPPPPPSAAGAFAGAPADAREQDALRRKTSRADAASGARGATTNAVPTFTAAEIRYRSLLARRVSNASEARSLREAWRAFAQAEPTGPRSDEARVRVVEVGWEAARLSKEDADREAFEHDAAEYLARADAAQPERVRNLLAP